MEFNDFETDIRNEKLVTGFLQEVLNDIPSAKVKEEHDRMLVVGGLDALFVIAAYALFRWAKDYLDNSRATRETDLAKYQQELISKLITEGFSRKEATATTQSLLDKISKRAAESDPALQKVLSLINK